ncbi:MAG: ABC transporter permease subunit [Kiritimatiellae bacterium]|nr:ABC transporter permease subunit [Kiritimatiellia bacterium]
MHPLSRARLERFRARKTAWVSLWLLAGLFVLSLGAELLANGKPLAVRHEGRWFFPAFRFYPADAFFHDGTETPPDWRAAEADLRARGARFCWAPIRFSPDEALDASALEGVARTSVVARRRSPVAAADVDAAGIVLAVRGEAKAFSLDIGNDAPLPEEARLEVARRAAGEGGEAADFALPAGGFASLSARPAGETGPVRVYFRQRLAGSEERKFRARPAEAGTMERDGWTFREETESVRFPFRPCRAHPLGLDAMGRDVASRMIHALRTSLLFGLLLACFSMAIAILVGLCEGYFAGKVDLVAQRLIEIWASLPFLYILILLSSVYGSGFGLLFAAYAAFNWVGVSQYMRAEALRLRREAFVEAARMAGLSTWRILLRHILPNALAPVVTFFPFELVGAIGSLAALDYLGFGLPPPAASFGELLSQAQEFPSAWWLVAFPAAALFGVMLLGVFVGEGLRAACDPRPPVRWDA